MRVVILYNTSWYVFLLRRNLISSLIEAGHTVSVLAPPDAYTERVKRLGVSYIPLSLNPTGTSPTQEIVTLLQIYQALRDAQPDAVLSYTIKCNLYAGLCRSRLSFRHVANISGLGQAFDSSSFSTLLIRQLYRRALANTDTVFFQNHDDFNTLIAQRIVSAAQSKLIPGSGVDLERFRPSPRPPRSQRSFLMLGRLLPKKGFTTFIEAARRAREKHGNRVAFWILGAPDYERPDSMDLLEQIIASHAQGVIRYLQSTDDVLPYIHDSDVVVLPSTYNEGIPRSLLEALACGKPIITTNWKGCRETVQHEHNGLLVIPDNTESLVRALFQLIECPTEKLAAMGHQSRRLAVERFDEQIVIASYHRAIGDTAEDPLRDRNEPAPLTSPMEQREEVPVPSLSSVASHASSSSQTSPLVRAQGPT